MSNSIDRRSVFGALRKIAALAALALTFGFAAEPAVAAQSDYARGLADGRRAGYSDGYKDGYQHEYRASFDDALRERGSADAYAAQRESGRMQQQYVLGYRRGYHDGYNWGYRAGEDDGGQAGWSDGSDFREQLRQEMRECMRRGDCD